MDPAKKGERQIDNLEAMVDAWAEEINLTEMITNSTSPMNLSVNAPPDVRRKFRERMNAQIFAIAQQAYIEGASRGINLVNDDLRQMRRESQQGVPCPICKT